MTYSPEGGYCPFLHNLFEKIPSIWINLSHCDDRKNSFKIQFENLFENYNYCLDMNGISIL